MEGAVELAEEIFSVPVRLGVPQHVSGLVEVVRNPIFATSVGLLIHGKGKNRAGGANQRKAGFALPDNLLARMKAWWDNGF